MTKILNENTPDKPYYKFENTFYLNDSYGNQGRLSFEINTDEMKRLIALFMVNKNTPKRMVGPIIAPAGLLDNPELELQHLKTFRKTTDKEEKLFPVPTLHIPLFIDTLKKTDIKFLYESREYVEQQAALRQEKEPLFNPKPKNHDRSKSKFVRRNRKFGE